MKNIAILNNGKKGSTGNIALNLHRTLIEKGYNSYFCFGRGEQNYSPNEYRIDKIAELRLHAFLTRVTGLQGSYSKCATKRLLSHFEKWGIDTVFIVCIHGYYINELRLYNFIKKKGIRLVHIMIDEYAYTGKCAYNEGCHRYQTGCGKCPHKNSYPSSFLFDGSSTVFSIKKRAYYGLSNAVFVGPQFVIEKAKSSPLMDNIRMEVLDEAIDMDVFCPRETSTLRNNLGIDGKKTIVLCVVPYDGRKNDRKGGRYFIELARKFELDDRFVFIHVGYRNEHIEDLPKNYYPIGYVTDLSLLAQYFSLGDIFVFPSLLDTMPNACLDALACGTPLLCFNVSGMPYIANKEVGTFVEPRSIEAMASVIQMTKKKTPAIIERCRQYALKRYDGKIYNEKLISIAESI